MPLSNERKKQLRSIGHGLKPIVTVAGNGLSANVLAETERALGDHELIKIKLAIEDREARTAIAAAIARQCEAEIVQATGKMILLLKEANKPNLKLSNLQRPQ